MISTILSAATHEYGCSSAIDTLQMGLRNAHSRIFRSIGSVRCRWIFQKSKGHESVHFVSSTKWWRRQRRRFKWMQNMLRYSRRKRDSILEFNHLRTSFCLLHAHFLPFMKSQDMYGLDCGHKFCRNCWSHYLTQKIVEEGLSKSIVCLEPSCEMLVDDENVFILIDDPEVINKYRRSMTDDFVLVQPSIRLLNVWIYCPKFGLPFFSIEAQQSNTMVSIGWLFACRQKEG